MAHENATGFGFTYQSVGATVLKILVGELVPVRATITVETAAVRYRYDGGAPLAGVGGGHLLNAGDSIVLEGTLNIRQFRMVANTSTAADVSVTLEAA